MKTILILTFSFLFLPNSLPVQSVVGEGNKHASSTHTAMASCFAICAHESHGSTGWTGPLRTGANGASLAAQDAAAHNKANPGHDASSSCQ
jgi:hypothetical protein